MGCPRRWLPLLRERPAPLLTRTTTCYVGRPGALGIARQRWLWFAGNLRNHLNSTTNAGNARQVVDFGGVLLRRHHQSARTFRIPVTTPTTVLHLAGRQVIRVERRWRRAVGTALNPATVKARLMLPKFRSSIEYAGPRRQRSCGWRGGGAEQVFLEAFELRARVAQRGVAQGGVVQASPRVFLLSARRHSPSADCEPHRSQLMRYVALAFLS
mmetsp:Transcript_83728/g.233505  ORF Transcript_83728/g.233505 Transcript_83728/m.233505 type:complete len:213 (+) Transcript_83728:1415-2053(+)